MVVLNSLESSFRSFLICGCGSGFWVMVLRMVLMAIFCAGLFWDAGI